MKDSLGSKLLVGTVGSITSGVQANELLDAGLDLAIVGRMFQKNPGLVFTFADELGIEVQMPNQIRWGVSHAFLCADVADANILGYSLVVEERRPRRRRGRTRRYKREHEVVEKHVSHRMEPKIFVFEFQTTLSNQICKTSITI